VSVNFLAISGDSKHFSFFPEKNPKKVEPLGQGCPTYFFYAKCYLFCDLKPHIEIRNPMINPSERKVTTSEREKEREKGEKRD
jgi:hypothetical protein